MKLHGNARLSVKGRELLIDRVQHAGWSLSSAAEAAGISDRTARKWLARYRAEGRPDFWIVLRRLRWLRTGLTIGVSS